MEFCCTKKFWITRFGTPDFSFGVHFCFERRVDIHFLFWMVSVGNIPIYTQNGEMFAASNSWHKWYQQNKEKRKRAPRLRAGVP